VKTVHLKLDGEHVEVQEGTTVAAALFNAGATRFRNSVNGAARGPICAMGICFECRVTIDGTTHQRSCMELCREGMEVATGD
jgi:sarcosine oxidase subunit alpha